MNITKLYSSHTSPFVRRVHLAFRRLGQVYDYEAVGNLFPPSQHFLDINPLGLIPALAIPNNEILVDSTEILCWMDQTYSGVWPKEMHATWMDRRLSALSAGVMTVAVSWRLENIRSDCRTKDQIDRENTILRTLDKIIQTEGFVKWEQRHQKLKENEDPFRLCYQGTFDLAIALDYLLFRLPHLDWQKPFPILREFLDLFGENKSFEETDPRKNV